MPSRRSKQEKDHSDLESLLSQATMNLSFCGCGFLGVYHLGVASCFLKHGEKMIDSLQRVGGASAGALTAAVLVTARDKLQDSIDMTFSLAKEMRSKPLGFLTPKYNVLKTVKRFLEKNLPKNAHEIASGKLFVSLTDARSKKNVVISEFESREELIKVLIASSYIPLYTGFKTPTVQGKKYMDGGFSNNLMQFTEGRTITVSPFSGRQDIGPQDSRGKAMFLTHKNQHFQVNFNNVRRGAHAFFPPRSSVLRMYFEQGERDAGRFLLREGLYELGTPYLTKSKTCVTLYESSV